MTTTASLTLASHVRLSVRQINRSNLSAGVSVLLLYLFAGLPIQIGVMTQLGLSSGESSSWFFVTWMTTGLFSFALALFTRQPVSINLSIPALIFMAGAAGGYSLPQIIGANLMVGVVAIALSTFRIADVFARLVPSQVAIGVFAGSMLLFMLKTSQMAVADLAIAGPIIAGFILTLAATRNQLLSVGVAAVVGLLGVVVTDGVPGAGASAGLPRFFPLTIELDPSAMIALGVPLLILVVGVGNTQSLAVLRSEGYAAKGNLFGLVAGAATVVNALGGGHADGIGGTTTVVSAGSNAGPSAYRYWAILISSVPVVVIAFAASPIIAFVQELPVTYPLTVGALALAMPFKQVMVKTLAGDNRTGALVAVLVAAIPLQLVGMPMAFWALVAGTAVVVLGSGQMRRYWRRTQSVFVSHMNQLGSAPAAR
ncbi:MAG TPA: hypothetical protein DCP37_01390 [Dehalococcoidia bacterium]|nr:hypothetical protein [Dehalococcoidia bacterium]